MNMKITPKDFFKTSSKGQTFVENLKDVIKLGSQNYVCGIRNV